MYEKIILITRKTRLEGLIEQYNTRAQAKFYLEHSGGDFAFYEQEHERYYAAVASLKRSLQGLLKLQTIERGYLPNFMFAKSDIVVTIGIDGTVVNAAKYLDGQPLVAVNPDPARIAGILLPFNIGSAPPAIRNLLNNAGKIRPISMAEAKLSDGQSLLAFNDFFVGQQTHISARYQIQFAGQAERHSSSGILVSTGVGATGWLSSVFNMANGVMRSFTTDQTPAPIVQPTMAWESDRLMFAVREPYVSKTTGADIVCGTITPDQPLVVESNMAEGGVIFSDGVEADFLRFNAGIQATICLATKKTNLVVT